MKKLCFPATARPHLARQKLLLEELRKHFQVDIFEPTTPQEGGMSVFSILLAVEFYNFLKDKAYDCVLLRGDRYEVLGLAMVSAYMGIPIAHIEGGDISGVIDNRIRKAITALSNIHFATNKESYVNLINQGTDPSFTFNMGSLDVEYAAGIEPKRLIEEPYILVAYHCIPGEDEKELEKALVTYAIS